MLIPLPPQAHWAPLLLVTEGASVFLQRHAADGSEAVAAAAVAAAPLSSPNTPPLPDVECLHVELSTGAVRLVRRAPLARPRARLVAAALGVLRLPGGGALLAVAHDAVPVAFAAAAAGAPPTPVYLVRDVQLLAPAAAARAPADVHVAQLLRAALEPRSSLGGHAYFSYGTDLTCRAAAQAARARAVAGARSCAAAWALTDARHTWNAAIAAPLLTAGGAAFVVPLVAGCLMQVQRVALNWPVAPPPPGAAPSADGAAADNTNKATAAAAAPTRLVEGCVTLLARRSTARAGAGPWRRGTDAAGEAANGVEVELLLTLAPRSSNSSSAAAAARGAAATNGAHDDHGNSHNHANNMATRPRAYAHVHVQGSAPVVWSQQPALWPPRPAPAVGGDADCAAALAAHAAALSQRYGRALTLVDLLSAKSRDGGGGEAELRDAVARAAAAVIAAAAASATSRGGKRAAGTLAAIDCELELLSADVMAGGRARLPAALDALDAELAPRVAAHGVLAADGLVLQGGGGAAAGTTTAAAAGCWRVVESQRGVLRLHSLEGADRVGLAGYVAGRLALEAMLGRAGLLSPGARLETALPELAANLRRMWHGMAEALALQSAGSEAIASDVVRHGAPTLGGFIDDAAMRASRWHAAAFTEARRQDALDVLHGGWEAAAAAAAAAGAPPPRVGRRQPAAVLAPLAAATALLLCAGQLAAFAARAFAGEVGAPSSAAATLLLLLRLLAPLALGAVLLRRVLARPEALVVWPELRPDLLPSPPPWHRGGGGGGELVTAVVAAGGARVAGGARKKEQ